MGSVFRVGFLVTRALIQVLSLEGSTKKSFQSHSHVTHKPICSKIDKIMHVDLVAD